MKYKERGGWAFLVLLVASWFMALASDTQTDEIKATIIGGVFLIMFKIERISNALEDVHNNGGEV